MKSSLFTDQMYFYKKGDTIDNFYFAITGVGAFVMSDLNNEMISVIDPVIFQRSVKKKKKVGSVN